MRISPNLYIAFLPTTMFRSILRNSPFLWKRHGYRISRGNKTTPEPPPTVSTERHEAPSVHTNFQCTSEDNTNAYIFLLLARLSDESDPGNRIGRRIPSVTRERETAKLPHRAAHTHTKNTKYTAEILDPKAAAAAAGSFVRSGNPERNAKPYA